MQLVAYILRLLSLVELFASIRRNPDDSDGFDLPLPQRESCAFRANGTCRLFKCREELLAVCSGHKHWYTCICPEGMCVGADGTCSFRKESWSVKTIPYGQNPPELPNGRQIRTAFTFAGGGTRAASASIGIIRALESLNLMPKIDAIIAISGALFTVVPYVFANWTNTEEPIWGNHVDPSQMTLDRIGKVSPLGAPYLKYSWVHPKVAFAKAVFGSIARMLYQDLHVDTKEWNRAWGKLMEDTFLTPWNLSSPFALLASSRAHVDEIKRKNPSLARASFLTPREDRPLLIIGTVLSGLKGQKHRDAAAFDVSAGFFGSPVGIDLRDDGLFGAVTDETKIQNYVGGGFIETFAVGGDAPRALGGSLPAPAKPFTLAKAFAIATYADFYEYRNFYPSLKYWPMKKGAKEATFAFGDGGFVDDTGLMNALRRGVRTVAVTTFPGGGEYDLNADFCTLWEKIQNKSWGQEDLKKWKHSFQMTDALLCIHGYGYDDGTWHKMHNMVFKREDIFKLGCELKTLRDSGKPAVVRMKQKTLANSYWGIKEGEDVDIIYLYLTKVKDFEDKLPAETRAKVSEKFPLDQFTALHQSPFDINMLDGMMHYNIMENADMYRDLFSA
eukprot:TRINITY_DN4990_c0_g1_i1.p1 TRINITY_DN4990_c0_g1~~TRINITY_DN4990_c0_g1_i1.p1  ORF type:complete len:615 (-),score=81.49 TRINITY_DN4990_c0_g1_i1:76-1920(-)